MPICRAFPAGGLGFGRDWREGHPADGEGPARPVHVDAFHIDRYGVTNRRRHDLCAVATPTNTPHKKKPPVDRPEASEVGRRSRGFLSTGYCQKLRCARAMKDTVLWFLNSYTAVGFGAVGGKTDVPAKFWAR
jgi:hypothetical protein